jgi:ABC-type tungstate transport system permease subunit
MKFRQWLGMGLLVLMSSTAMAVEHLKMSTTTSTDNSGLLAVLKSSTTLRWM